MTKENEHCIPKKFTTKKSNKDDLYVPRRIHSSNNEKLAYIPEKIESKNEKTKSSGLSKKSPINILAVVMVLIWLPILFIFWKSAYSKKQKATMSKTSQKLEKHRPLTFLEETNNNGPGKAKTTKNIRTRKISSLPPQVKSGPPSSGGRTPSGGIKKVAIMSLINISGNEKLNDYQYGTYPGFFMVISRLIMI